MSFSVDTKNELARITPGKKCCQLAEIAGFIRMSGRLRLVGGGRVALRLGTENPAVARHYKKLMKTYFGTNAHLLVGRGNFQKQGHLYELRINETTGAEQILRETGILRVREGCNDISDGVYEGILKTKCCRKSYLRGMFLGAGSLNDPEKGYHFEIICGTEALAADVRKLLNSFVDIHAKTALRKGHFVVYVKDAEQIADILNILGAHGQLLKLENVRIVKELRNKTNRISNCDNANLDKALQAAERQIRGIEKIRDGAGLPSLPEALRLAAVFRLENPEASLTELGEMMAPPVSKAAVYRRLKKIEDLAARLT